jgi:hypothetical protein
LRRSLQAPAGQHQYASSSFPAKSAAFPAKKWRARPGGDHALERSCIAIRLTRRLYDDSGEFP